ncbi:hypothetical protein AB0N81_37750 [Streptomyces sp. NPDC093510]|uniref:hypothetical protein n=1 Tax=Streptomyces sp. NPDC093510 TaxID=3155199 RepID=UPI0034317981
MLSRARTPWCPLVAVLLVVLGLLCGGPSTAGAGPAEPSAVVTAVVTATAGATPGCGKGSPQDADHVPGTPARSGSSYELLPALYDAHAATGACAVDHVVTPPLPGRAPPALDPPSPMELSVLRV